MEESALLDNIADQLKRIFVEDEKGIWGKR